LPETNNSIHSIGNYLETMAGNTDNLRLVDLAVIDSAVSIDSLRLVYLVVTGSSDAVNMDFGEIARSLAKE
jgi:hypothetical protein